MKKNFLTSVAFALALVLVDCDDSTSANSSPGDENPAEESSSSVTPSSSSRVILSSSSSVSFAIAKDLAVLLQVLALWFPLVPWSPLRRLLAPLA